MRLRHRRLHLWMWLALAVLLPGVLLAGLAMRQGGGRAAPEGAPVRLAPP